MIFRRRKKGDDLETEPDGPAGVDGSEVEAEPGPAAGDSTDAESGLDVAALDARDWRGRGPWDIAEVDLDADPPAGRPRIDLGSVIITGFGDAELRLQVAEETETIVSAMLVHGDSALEISAYAAPRSGGLWPELREDLIANTEQAGGSSALAEGPFGVELRRLLPVTAPGGEEGYQPSRMWVVEGPRWLLRGILYGQAALEDGVEEPVTKFLTAFREVIVRRGEQAMAPGDLLPLTLPAELQTGEAPDPTP